MASLETRLPRWVAKNACPQATISRMVRPYLVDKRLVDQRVQGLGFVHGRAQRWQRRRDQRDTGHSIGPVPGQVTDDFAAAHRVADQRDIA
jgi:hypothetical protein